jgi:hypothetical protein
MQPAGAFPSTGPGSVTGGGASGNRQRPQRRLLENRASDRQAHYRATE